MHCYYIQTVNQRHFIIEAETAEKAMSIVSTERTLTCPWTKKTLLSEPALKVQYCERLSLTPQEKEEKPPYKSLGKPKSPSSPPKKPEKKS